MWIVEQAEPSSNLRLLLAIWVIDRYRVTSCNNVLKSLRERNAEIASALVYEIAPQNPIRLSHRLPVGCALRVYVLFERDSHIDGPVSDSIDQTHDARGSQDLELSPSEKQISMS